MKGSDKVISKYSVLRNLADLNTDEKISDDLRDAIERVTDDVKEILEYLDEIKSGYSA